VVDRLRRRVMVDRPTTGHRRLTEALASMPSALCTHGGAHCRSEERAVILTRSDAGVAERQTRRSQKPLGATPCGFESHLRHRTRTGKSWGKVGYAGVTGVRQRSTPEKPQPPPATWPAGGARSITLWFAEPTTLGLARSRRCTTSGRNALFPGKVPYLPGPRVAPATAAVKRGPAWPGSRLTTRLPRGPAR
jgi:hypothetical protein